MSTIIVIPCFNEVKRLDTNEFLRYARRPGAPRLLLVNDGSTDYTAEMLNGLRAKVGALDVLHLEKNGGKAEAVRRGVLFALQQSPQYIGYWDADLATPLDAIDDFVRTLDRREDIDVVVGCRTSLLGRRIKRHPLRKILGRTFAAVASRVLGLSIKDTQCGAKLFRVNEQTAAAFAEPFQTGWIFDVEVLARLINLHGGVKAAAAKLYEQPLDRWEDVPGSKLKPKHFVQALGEMATIYLSYLRPFGPRYHAAPPMVAAPARRAA